MSIHEFLSDEYFTDLDEFEDLINQFIRHMKQRLQDFQKYKKHIFTKMKKVILEKAFGSILEDLDRMP